MVWGGRLSGRRLSGSKGPADSGLRATGPCLSALVNCGSLPQGGSAGGEGKPKVRSPSRRGVTGTGLPPQPGRARFSVARKPKRHRPRVLRPAVTYVAPLSSKLAPRGAGLFHLAAIAVPAPGLSARPANGAAAEKPDRLFLPQAAVARFSPAAVSLFVHFLFGHAKRKWTVKCKAITIIRGKAATNYQ